jgi:hypothetical protein
MEIEGKVLALWVPRVLGIGVALFIGMFAMDAVREGVLAFLLHLTPAFALLGVVALSWRWPWIGGLVFSGLALLYALNVTRWDWIVVISGPLLLVGVLFLLSWYHGRQRYMQG